MWNPSRYHIILAGIGGDAHSVGLILLRQALQLTGYQVHYLGTQNRIEDVLEVAPGADAVLLSCMDGHAGHYLKPLVQHRLNDEEETGPLWYLGGNPSVLPPARARRVFAEMGFKRVYLGFVDLTAFLEGLAEDLHSRVPSGGPAARIMPERNAAFLAIADWLLHDVDHDLQRREVLLGWPTGAAANDFNDNASFLKTCPSLALAQSHAARKGRPLVQPRAGVALADDQQRLFHRLRCGGADVLSYQIDSLTRNNRYSEAEEGIAESRQCGQSTLNGFPLVNHGVDALRRIARSVPRPLQCRHSTRDPRLLAELCYAGGVTAFEGGAICYNLPYFKDYPLAEAIQNWRYVDRLTGRYLDRYGIVIDREFFGVLTATLMPPSIAITVCILEAALAVRQGVGSVSLGYAEQGNRVQDIAAIRAIPGLARNFFRAVDLPSVQISTVFHQYMSAFPEDEGASMQLIHASAETAALSGATRVLTKTAVEAVRIPTVEDNVAGLQTVHRGIALAGEGHFENTSVRIEQRLIEAEVSAMLDAVLVLGSGDVAVGLERAFANGNLDIPFSPSVHNAGQVVTGRDITGAVRFLSCGNLPLSREAKQFHEECMAERRRRDSVPIAESYRIVEDDVLALPRGRVPRWPLSERTITGFDPDMGLTTAVFS